MSSLTDSDRILAAGVLVELAGGEARLRFDFLAFHRIEEHYGSIAAAAKALNTLWDLSNAPLEQPVLEDLSVLLGAGLRLTPEEVLEQLPVVDLSLQIPALVLACMSAWGEAFPAPARAEGNGQAEPTSNGSRGPTSTGSSPASPAEPTTSSGE